MRTNSSTRARTFKSLSPFQQTPNITGLYLLPRSSCLLSSLSVPELASHISVTWPKCVSYAFPSPSSSLSHTLSLSYPLSISLRRSGSNVSGISSEMGMDDGTASVSSLCLYTVFMYVNQIRFHVQSRYIKNKKLVAASIQSWYVNLCAKLQ